MHVALRVDASVATGAGHLMRCLALVEELSRRRAKTWVLMGACPAGLRPLVAATGATLVDLDPCTNTADDALATRAALRALPAMNWGVVDHYGLGAAWEHALKDLLPRLLVIDDLANRPHSAHLLLDQNLWREPETRYFGLLTAGCRRLLGPEYALLRREFAETLRATTQLGAATDSARLLASFGGTDPTGETLKFLDALPQLSAPALKVDLIVGAAHPMLDEVSRRATKMKNVALHVQTREMARLLSAASVAVGAGGSSHWERMQLGVPSLCTAVADNQVEACELLHERGATRYLGRATEVDARRYATAVDALLADEAARNELAATGRAIMGGGGGAIRVADAMFDMTYRGL